MKTYLTGNVVFNDSKLGVGYGTRFLLETRPGDVLEIAGNVVTVRATLDDTHVIVTERLSTNNVKMCLVDVNPVYCLSIPAVKYTTHGVQYGNTVSGNVVPSLIASQAFNNAYDQSLQTINTNKAIVLDDAFDYSTPATDCVMVRTTMGSQLLYVSDLTVMLSVTINSTLVTQSIADTTLLITGMTLQIDTQVYTIDNTRGVITLDRPAHATISDIKCYCPNDLDSRYPIGSTLLLNGRLCLVQGSTPSFVQILYPVDVTADVTIRKPLMGRQYSKNTIELYNNNNSPALEPGDIIIIQDLQSPDSLYSTSTCYTELKQVARVYNETKHVTVELNKRSFSGLVCIGKPSLGLGVVGNLITVNNHVYSTTVNLTDYFAVNDFIVIDEMLRTVLTVSSSELTIDFMYPSVSVCRKIKYVRPTRVSSYTPTVNRLAYLQACEMLFAGVRKISTMNELIRMYSKKTYFAYELVIAPTRIFGQFEPELYAMERMASPPLSLEQNFAASINASSTGHSELYQAVKHAGLPLVSIA